MSGWVFITGAAKRIGREIALDLARCGYDILVHYHTSQRAAVQTAKDIHALGRKSCLVELDLADLRLVRKIIPCLRKEFGPLAALVNNASLFLPDHLDPENLQVKVNAQAPRLLSEAFYMQAKSSPAAAIVNLLDAAPITPGFSHYNDSKKILADLTYRHALRFAPQLRVNGLALGPVLPAARQSLRHFRKLVDKTLLKKPVLPQDVAWTVRFLIGNSSLTGSILAVDGGQHLCVLPKSEYIKNY